MKQKWFSSASIITDPIYNSVMLRTNIKWTRISDTVCLVEFGEDNLGLDDYTWFYHALEKFNVTCISLLTPTETMDFQDINLLGVFRNIDGNVSIAFEEKA